MAEIIGNPIIFYGIVALLISLCLKSALCCWLLRIFLLAAWGVGTIGMVLFVAIFIHWEKQNYGAAIATVLIGGVLYIPWLFLGFPRLVSELRKGFRT